MPKISVIIPSYNSAHCLPDAIDSILAQDYQNLEILVVDDGSTDNTKDVINSYINSVKKNRSCRILYVYKENGGVSSARNVGIENARGEYIAFLDADDTLLENSISQRVAFMEENQEVGIVFTNYYIFANEDKSLSEHKIAYDEIFLTNLKSNSEHNCGDNYIMNKSFYPNFLSFRPFPIWTGTVMIRKTILDSVGIFREDISSGEDRDYWMRIIKNHIVGYIDTVLSCYHNYQSTLTKNIVNCRSDRIIVFKELLCDDNELDNNRLKEIISEEYFELGYYYYKNNEYLRSKLCFFQALINSRLSVKLVLFYTCSA